MKPNETIQRSKFLVFVIFFYRFLGITFGGVSIDKNGKIIKSKFWYYFGWFGFVLFSIPIIFFIIASVSIDHVFRSKNLTMYWIITIIWHITCISMIYSIVIINQKYGFKILKMLIKHSLTEYTKLGFIKIIWIVHLLIIFIIFMIQSCLFPFYSYVTYAFINSLMLLPLYYSISFISWIISTNFIENIKIIRKHLNQKDASLKIHHFTQANNFMLINYKIINKIDDYLSFGFITSFVGVILSMMSSVYLGIFGHKLNFLHEILTFDVIYQILQLIQLILNCFINGKVNEETVKLLSHLDNININVFDDKLFKTYILFKTSIVETKSGFTIARFANWNNLTLLQVNYFHFECDNQFIHFF